MMTSRLLTVAVVVVLGTLGAALLSAQQRATPGTVAADIRRGLGGPTGLVKTDKGQPVDGLMVQVISEKTAIRTTVFTDESGAYEFPKLETGDYTLRIARPLEFRQYRKDGVRIDGATRLPEIIVSRVTESQFLPPTVDILSQLSGAELLHNTPGSEPEKRAFVSSCGGSCHSFDYPLRVTYDEASWDSLLRRMTNYSFRILLRTRGAGMEAPLAGDELMVKNWLARVRGPNSPALPPFKPFPRPMGRAKRAIVTEYELPWTAVNIHDVSGDKDGNIWFSVNKSPFIGKLEPATGKITSYRVPKPPPWNMKWDRSYKTSEEFGVHPGIHWIEVDQQSGVVWFMDTWAGALGRFDPRTQEFQQVHTGTHGNVGLARDGKTLWKIQDKSVQRFDAATVMKTGLPEKTFPLKRVTGTYGTCLSWDGNTMGGGGGGGVGVWHDIRTSETREIEGATDWASGGRCDFDPAGNLWTGSKEGPLLKYNPKTNIVSQYESPTPFTSLYGARSDKNGEIWVGLMHGARIGRFDPKTQNWTAYVLPSTFSFDFFSWVDNSTTPVTYWYGDQFGYIVRVQPLD